ncbi:hypothetical protein BN341_3980 [Helicobacter heilmannii ASB1.4]|uniref:Uncharacterized protein n=1 Tax=Helicobacter heilmannii TaxID=35817 RepID=A0A0K2Y7M9_HELHE|nr:hypothetical protein BN341_3930 [Helicobacter heilmannii ASB1.4]CCM73374.1 hypothetical protein BN341_3980 [Helicobacter heilmannii ASB1.4]CRI34137.1 hypothetical protein HHE01_09830 [Helicobacter heilmannii]
MRGEGTNPPIKATFSQTPSPWLTAGGESFKPLNQLLF